MRHGVLPAPEPEQLLEPDPDVYLAGGPLHETCAGGCDGLCECET